MRPRGTGWLLLAVGMALTFPTRGQYWMGVTNSNYAGTHALYRNPAEAADSRYRLYVNLAAADAYVANNHVRWAAPFSLVRYLTGNIPADYRRDRGRSLRQTGYVRENLNGKLKQLYFGTDVRGPSALINLGDRFGLGLTSRVRAGLSFRQTSEGIARLLVNGTQIRELQGIVSANQTGYANANGFAEIGATFGAVVRDNDEDFWKVGVTVKRLVGLFNTHIQVDNGTHEIIRDPALVGFQALMIRQFEGRYGFTQQGAFENARPTPGWLLGRTSAGGGWGLDLGVTYEHRPDIRQYTYREKGVLRRDASRNKYQYRISASLVDVGGIRYRNAAYVSQYDVAVVNKMISNGTFLGVKSIDDANARIVNLLDLRPEQRKTAFRSGLPTTFNLTADYRVQNNLYVGGMWTQSLRKPDAVALLTPSMVAVVPRWESRWAELSLPIALQDNYSMFTVGVAARVGPLFVGTDHLGGLANIGNPRGANLYAGVALPLYRRGPANPNACYYPPQEGGFWKRWGRRR